MPIVPPDLTHGSFRQIWNMLGLSVLVACSLLLAACEQKPEFSEKRFRLEINLLVDGEPVSGSVVQKLRIRIGHASWGTRLIWRLYGRALVMQLPGDRPFLIVPMSLPDSERPNVSGIEGEEYYKRMFISACEIRGTDEVSFFDALTQFEGTCVVESDQLPLILSSTDLSDPAAISLADPTDLSSTFNGNVELVSITVSPTQDPYDDAYAFDIPWAYTGKPWPKRYLGGIYGEGYDTPLSMRLYPDAFFRIEPQNDN